MSSDRQPANLVDVLDRLEAAARQAEPVTLGTILESVGRQSFGPLLLVLGLMAVSPLSGIPGIPTTIGLLVVLVAGQLLLRRKQFWLPAWLLRRKVSRAALSKAVDALRAPARRVDRLLHPRLGIVTGAAGRYLIALHSVAIAVTMPPLEVVPFAATTAGLGIAVLGLALTARDGVVGLIAVAFALGALGFVASSFG